MSLTEAMCKVGSIDLAILKLKLCNGLEGPNWSTEFFNEVEREYRRFLIMNLVHPDRRMAPSKNVDEMWHYHILDTRKYASDCHQLGCFLHHFPYLGLRGGNDSQKLAQAGDTTLDTYVELFGEQPRADVWWERSLPTCSYCDGDFEPVQTPSSDSVFAV